MKHFRKRAGWFFLALAALLASLFLQIFMGVIAMLPASVIAGFKAGMQGIADPYVVEKLVMERMLDAAVWGVLLYHVVSLPVFGLWYYFGCGRPKPESPFKVLKLRGLSVVAVAGFGLCLVANGIAMMIRYVAPYVFAEYVELMESAGMGVNILSIIASVLLAPIGEELLCRGIIMHYGRKMSAGLLHEKVSFWLANVLQALLFGIMHGNFVQGTYAFVLGMGLGLLRYRYDSLYPAIFCHFAINFLSTFVMGYLFWWIPDNLYGTFLMFGIGGVITLLAVCLAGEKKERISS